MVTGSTSQGQGQSQKRVSADGIWRCLIKRRHISNMNTVPKTVCQWAFNPGGIKNRTLLTGGEKVHISTQTNLLSHPTACYQKISTL